MLSGVVSTDDGRSPVPRRGGDEGVGGAVPVGVAARFAVALGRQHGVVDLEVLGTDGGRKGD